MVVDDDLDARNLFTRALEQYDARVTAVASAGAALTALERWKPDVLVSDIAMPDESGYVLMRKIRRLPPDHGGTIPALALTAYAGANDVELARSADQSAQAIAASYIKAGRWHTFSGSEPIVDGMQLVPLPGHTPGHTGYEFSSKGQRILFWGDIVHAQRVQLQHPEVTAVFDIDQTAAAATRHQLLPRLAREDVLIAAPHTSIFPALGRLRKEGSGYSWVPVVFTDQWTEK